MSIPLSTPYRHYFQIKLVGTSNLGSKASEWLREGGEEGTAAFGIVRRKTD